MSATINVGINVEIRHRLANPLSTSRALLTVSPYKGAHPDGRPLSLAVGDLVEDEDGILDFLLRDAPGAFEDIEVGRVRMPVDQAE